MAQLRFSGLWLDKALLSIAEGLATNGINRRPFTISLTKDDFNPKITPIAMHIGKWYGAAYLIGNVVQKLILTADGKVVGVDISYGTRQ